MFGGSSPEIDVRRLIGISPEIDGRRLIVRPRRPARGLAHRFLDRVNRNGEIGAAESVSGRQPHTNRRVARGHASGRGRRFGPFFRTNFRYENGKADKFQNLKVF
jgi:hypothetical protein